MLEQQAEAILKKMTVNEMRNAAKIGIMLTLVITGRTVQSIKKIIQEESKNGK